MAPNTQNCKFLFLQIFIAYKTFTVGGKNAKPAKNDQI